VAAHLTAGPASTGPLELPGLGPRRRLAAAPSPPPSKRPDLRTEKLLLRGGVGRLAAIDEVGRGALAGPVTVGVVVVTPAIGRVPPGLRDSKLLTPAARTALVTPIRRWAREYAVGHASSLEIDLFGILGGLRLAALRALAALDGIDAVLLDGNFNYLAGSCDLPMHTRIKGDLTCAGVSAASVLAKTERDALMVTLAGDHPEYGFAENKGYSTPEHIEALRVHGPSRSHRTSWRLPGCSDGMDDQPTMFEDMSAEVHGV
jgi:ribonuclease HII